MSAEASPGWILAIDFGTSFTAAAIRAREQLRVLETDGVRRLPSAVFLAPDGFLLVGEAAENRAGLEPERLERTPKAYLEVGEPSIPLGGQLVPVVDVVGRILNVVWQEALRQQGGVAPAQVYLTHPASWSIRRQELLREAAGVAGIHEPLFVSEPEAAAIYLASEQITGQPIPDRAPVAVYDLGGGTFDTAVLRRASDHFDVVGDPGGDEHIGGELFDDKLYRRLGESGLDASDWERLQTSQDRDWRRANHEFRQQVRNAKEAISRAASYPLYVPAPVSRDLQVTRQEFEQLIEDDLVATVDILERTIRSAGVEPSELAAIYLVGGSARIPLVSQLVRERFGRADLKGDTKTVVALGAARAALSATKPGAETASEGVIQASEPASAATATDTPSAPAPVTTSSERWIFVLGLLGVLAGLVLLAASAAADSLGLSTSDTSSEEFGGVQVAGTLFGALVAAAGGVVAYRKRWPSPGLTTFAARTALAALLGLLLLGVGALLVLRPGPSAAELLMTHVPQGFRDTCLSQGSNEKITAIVRCTPDAGADSVTYTQYSDGKYMNKVYDAVSALARVSGSVSNLDAALQGLPEEPDILCPGWRRGKGYCSTEGSSSEVVWTDEALRILASARRSSGNAETLFEAFGRSAFGPVR